MRNQFLIAILSTVHMDLIPPNGIVFRKIYRVRPAAIRLFFSIVPYQVILSVHFAPHRQIYLLIYLGILHCDLHGCKVGGYLRRNSRCFFIYDFRHLNSRMTCHTKGIRIACADISVNLVSSGRIVFCQIHRVFPCAICLLYRIIPNQVILSIFFAPYRKFRLCVSMARCICHPHRQGRAILHSRYRMISAGPTGLVYRSAAIITVGNFYFRTHTVNCACNVVCKLMGHIFIYVNKRRIDNTSTIISMNRISSCILIKAHRNFNGPSSIFLLRSIEPTNIILPIVLTPNSYLTISILCFTQWTQYYSDYAVFFINFCLDETMHVSIFIKIALPITYSRNKTPASNHRTIIRTVFVRFKVIRIVVDVSQI